MIEFDSLTTGELFVRSTKIRLKFCFVPSNRLNRFATERLRRKLETIFGYKDETRRFFFILPKFGFLRYFKLQSCDEFFTFFQTSIGFF